MTIGDECTNRNEKLILNPGAKRCRVFGILKRIVRFIVRTIEYKLVSIEEKERITMKVLILANGTGGGHMAAAYALQKAFEVRGYEADVLDPFSCSSSEGNRQRECGR